MIIPVDEKKDMTESLGVAVSDGVGANDIGVSVCFGVLVIFLCGIDG